MNGGPTLPRAGLWPAHSHAPGISPTPEQIAEYEQRQKEYQLAQEREARVIRWRGYLSISLQSLAVVGPDTKKAMQMADELAKGEDERFNKAGGLTVLETQKVGLDL